MRSIFKKILSLLDRGERKRLYMLFGAMTVSGLIEVAGIVSILPFLSLITNPELINSNRYLNWLYINLNFHSTNRFLIFIGIMVLLILIVSNIVIVLTMWGEARFTSMRNYSISRRLLSRYLYQPYVFYLNKNTTELGKNILSEVAQVTSVLVQLIQIISSGIVALFIFIMLLIVEPLLALSVMVVLGVAYVFIYRMVKKKIYNLGKVRFDVNTDLYKVVDEAFGGIKQLKLLGFEEVFINRYSKPSFEYAKVSATNQIISRTPRYVMEVVSVGGIISVVLYLLAFDRGFQDTIPIIGLFAFAAFRIMPALQNIFASVTALRYYIPALDVLYNEMYSFDNKSSYTKTDSKKEFSQLSLQKELKLEGITFCYPGTSKLVIDNLNIKINCNTSVAFVGKTGVGKTTIADIILGLLRPTSGRILVDGVEITDANLPGWQKNLGYIPQDIYLLDDTVTRNIAFGVPDEKIDMNIVRDVAQIANIHNFVTEELPNKYQTVVGERGIRLSGGQRQRIGIARALYHNPGVLVLDEATSALDGATEKEVFEAINNVAQTKTLIIIAHRLTTVKGCDIIYVMKDSKIAGQGKYEELMESNMEFRYMAKAHL